MKKSELRKIIQEEISLLKGENTIVIEESLKNNAIGALLILTTIFGGYRLGTQAERALEAGAPVEMSVRHSILSKDPLKRDTYTLNVDTNQSEPVTIDVNSGTITTNTSDWTDYGIKRAVHKKLGSIDKDLTSMSTRSIGLDIGRVGK